MLLIENCEMFYTDSKKATDELCLVDQIMIDKNNKEYFLQTDKDLNITEVYQSCGIEISSVYVSRFVFDIIVSGVKGAKFKEAIYVR